MSREPTRIELQESLDRERERTAEAREERNSWRKAVEEERNISSKLRKEMSAQTVHVRYLERRVARLEGALLAKENGRTSLMEALNQTESLAIHKGEIDERLIR